MAESREFKYMTVYDDGRVWSNKTNKFLERKDREGYIKISQWPWLAHRLIWFVFNGELPEGYDVHHINGDRADNRLENLALLEGRLHAKKHGIVNWTEDKKKIMLSSLKKSGLYERFKKFGNSYHPTKKIVQLSLEGDFVKEWSSLSETGRNGYHTGNVCNCCKKQYNRPGNNIYHGFRWMYYEEWKQQKDIIKQLIHDTTWVNVNEKKHLVQLLPDGTVIHWPSSHEAERNGGFSRAAVSRCCKGKQQTHKGFKWMYFSDYEAMKQKEKETQLEQLVSS